MSISSNYNFSSFGGITLSGQGPVSRKLGIEDSVAVIVDFNRPVESSWQTYNSNGAFKETASSTAIRQALQKWQEIKDLYGEDCMAETFKSLKEPAVKLTDIASQAKTFLNLSETNKYAVNIADINSLAADLEVLEGELLGMLESSTNPLEIKAIKQQLSVIKALSSTLQTIIKNLFKIDDALDVEGLKELAAWFDKMKEKITDALALFGLKNSETPIKNTIENMREQLKTLFELSHVVGKKIKDLKELEELQNSGIKEMLDGWSKKEILSFSKVV
jgi:hypothetical protein